MSCQLSDDIRKSKWEKMCWNCVFNPVTVLIDDKVAKALDHPESVSTRADNALEEIARELHIDHGESWAKLLKALGELVRDDPALPPRIAEQVYSG